MLSIPGWHSGMWSLIPSLWNKKQLAVKKTFFVKLSTQHSVTILLFTFLRNIYCRGRHVAQPHDSCCLPAYRPICGMPTMLACAYPPVRIAWSAAWQHHRVWLYSPSTFYLRVCGAKLCNLLRVYTFVLSGFLHFGRVWQKNNGAGRNFLPLWSNIRMEKIT